MSCDSGSSLLVHYVDQRLAVDEALDVLFDCPDHASTIAIGAAGDMGRDDDVVEFPEGVAFGERLRIGNVDSSAGDFSAIEGFHQRRKVVDATPADGDEVCALFHQVELVRAHHFVALLGVGSGDEDDIGERHHVVDLVRLYDS